MTKKKRASNKVTESFHAICEYLTVDDFNHLRRNLDIVADYLYSVKKKKKGKSK
jgi:hypothetical protein